MSTEEQVIDSIKQSDDEKLNRILQDSALREELGVGRAMTGPKGVLSDHAFHAKQERVRNDEKRANFMSELSSNALPSGWLQKQLELEDQERYSGQGGLVTEVKKDDEDIDELLKQLEDEIDEEKPDYELMRIQLKRMEAMKTAYMKGKKGGRGRFGELREVDLSSFVPAIENEDQDVIVIIHVYQDYIEECKNMNRSLLHLAKKYPGTKFLKANVRRIEAKFDDVVLPVLLCYQAGDLTESFIRIQDQVGERLEADDLEAFLISKEILNQHDVSDLV